MSCPTLEARRIAERSTTIIRGAGSAPPAAPAAGGCGLSCATARPVVASMEASPAATSVVRIVNIDFPMSLESCSCAEIDDLRLVIAFLDVRHGQGNLDGPEGRFPVDAKTNRRTECHIVLDAHKARREGGAIVGRHSRREMAHRAEIAEQRQADSVICRQELGKSQVGVADRVRVATDGIGSAGADFAGSDARQLKSRETVATL